jgi:hypothetical protein
VSSASLYPPPLVRGEDTGLYSIYASTLCSRPSSQPSSNTACVFFFTSAIYRKGDAIGGGGAQRTFMRVYEPKKKCVARPKELGSKA